MSEMPPASKARDTWAFGITVVEVRFSPDSGSSIMNNAFNKQIFSGAPPYPHLHDAAVVIYVYCGGRPQHRECPRVSLELWKQLERCWHADPKQRPALTELHQFLLTRTFRITP